MATLERSIGAATSGYKIECKGSTILIGGEEYLSATDALEAYISQYERKGLLSNTRSGSYKRTVNDLLNPKSALHMTAERSLDTGVRDTEMELRLADTKDSINESLLKMKKNVSLKAQAKRNNLRKQKQRVDEALNKSHELMRQINTDEYPKTSECPSDVGSLNTEILLSIDPANPASVAEPNWKSRHVYGYKRPRARRSKTLSSIQISHDIMGLTSDQPAQSFTAQPTDKTAQHVKFHDDDITCPDTRTNYDDDVSILLGESPNTSRLSRSPNKKIHERSRSVSPSILKRERKMFESGLRDKPIPDFYTDFNTLKSKAPSWINTMNTSDVSDSDWTKRDFTTSRPPPSWVHDMDTSDITSVVSSPLKPTKTLHYEDLLRPLPIINTQRDNSLNNSDLQDTLPGPGLTFKDLLGDVSNLKVQTGNSHNQNGPNSPTLSEKLKVLKVKTTNALEKFHERSHNEFDTPSKGSNPYVGDNLKCSSFHVGAMTKGIPPPGSTSITGASPIIGDNFDNMLTIGGSPGKISRPKTPDTDFILDGDRPWENTASYKPPVSVGNTSKRSSEDEKTYSGGPQHGSLEQLKNMIFKLQQEAVHTDSEDEGSRQKLSERVYKLRAEAANLGIPVPQTGDVPALKDYDYQGEPGGQSLEKAMVHLERLKTLVSTSQQKKEGENQNSGRVTPLCAHME